MESSMPTLVLSGTLRLSVPGAQRTAGRFNELVTDNAAVFRRHFGVVLFPGSLNVDVPEPASLQRNLDAGIPSPAFVIPKAELVNMPAYIGDGQAWPCVLHYEKSSIPISCWIFRRIGSRVPQGVIELVASTKLRDTYSLQHGDPITIHLMPNETEF